MASTEHTSLPDEIKTVAQALRHWALISPDRPAFIFRAPDSNERQVQTFSSIYQLAGRWAAVLHRNGIRQGDFVATILPNSPERVVVEASILLSGASSVSAFCQLSDASELLAVLLQSRAAALVLDPDANGTAWTALKGHLQRISPDGSVVSTALPNLKYVYLVQCQSVMKREGACLEGSTCHDNLGTQDDFLTSLETSPEEHFHNFDSTSDDICIVICTSGTSGLSKLVAFSNSTLLSIARALKRKPSIEYNNGIMGWFSGYTGNIFLSGGTRVLCDGRCGAPRHITSFIYNSVVEENVVSGTVPLSYLHSLADYVTQIGREDPLFYILALGTQPVTRDNVLTARRLATMVVVGYACTEIPFIAGGLLAEPEKMKDYFAGKAFPGVQLKICDEAEHEVETGVRGEILVKSPYRLLEYLHAPEATTQAFTQDGYFRTGDIGWLDAEGCLYVEGRGKDAIMRGAQVLYPGWLEARICSCPLVKEVVVVGIPDPNFINEVCACIVTKSPDVSTDDVQRFVEEDIVAGYDDLFSPRPRFYLIFDAFPLTITGKPIRKEIARLAQERLKNAP